MSWLSKALRGDTDSILKIVGAGIGLATNPGQTIAGLVGGQGGGGLVNGAPGVYVPLTNVPTAAYASTPVIDNAAVASAAAEAQRRTLTAVAVAGGVVLVLTVSLIAMAYALQRGKEAS